ncbi:MAG: fasciclin domain-containing protein [Planctomycetia bacterium]|nr:fasciclin domain-containing protein [Planctomycetia bacterium]
MIRAIGFAQVTAVVMAVACGTSLAAEPVRQVALRQTADIVDTAVAAGTFKTLAAAVGAAGLVDTLKGDGPFTVFAPTDEAFKKLPAGTVETLLKPENKEKLKEILLLHVVPGSVMAADVVKLKEAKTAGGKTVMIGTEGGVTVGTATGKAKVVKTDIKAKNGVIHVIDTVILP